MLRRLRPVDRVLLLTLVPLWLACFGLYVGAVLSGRLGTFGFGAITAKTETGYPVVVAVAPDPQLASHGLKRGDQLLRIGNVDLQGFTNPYRFFVAAVAQIDQRGRAAIQYRRDGETYATVVEAWPMPFWWARAPFVLSCVIVALVCLLRAPHWRLSRPIFLACMFISLAFSLAGVVQNRLVPIEIRYFSTVLARPLLAATYGILSWCVYFFPDEPKAGRSWHALIAWTLALGFGYSDGFYPLISWFPVLEEYWWLFVQPTRVPWFELILVHAGLVITWRYLRNDRAARRRMRWCVLGLCVGGLPFLVWFLLLEMGVVEWSVYGTQIAHLALPAMPIGFLIAVFGYRMIDVDRLISATASYSILAVLVLGGVLALVPRLADATSSSVGVDPSSAQLVLSLALAAIAIPVHRTLRPRIDRLFFPERATLDAGIAHLLGELSRVREPRELNALAGERLDALLRPESCIVYARGGPAFEPVFVRGKAVPPAFEGQSALVATLTSRTSPLASDRFSRRDRLDQLSAFDRAALETLGAAVVVPFHRGEQLVAFLCLGPKRSSDIYTSTDLALLTAVASAVGGQLERLGQEEIAREARAMQRELRRYVPEAVARGLEGGEALEPRERAVSVLFVDIRGYTSYAERRRAEEVFSTVDRYTTRVSAIVQKCGGFVVEFNGDGMMAVFGAPTPLSDKERAALAAGREIVTAISSLGGVGAAEEISVGVGIATGSAFVGTIQSTDRLIWTALGNTTNLAARLQGLTRELDAAIVIDLATWRAAGETGADFVRREQVPIRGRQHREDVYVLPLANP